KNIEQTKASTKPVTIDLFDFVGQNDHPEFLNRDYTIRIDKSVLNKLLVTSPDLITLEIPIASGKIKVDLYQHQLFASGFVFRTASGQSRQAENMLFYHGGLQNNPASIASLTIYEDGIALQISDMYGDYNFHRMNTDEYVIYNDHDIIHQNGFTCEAKGLNPFPDSEEVAEHHSRSSAVGDCIDVYVELDFEMYQRLGSSVDEAELFIAVLFNEVAAMYTAEAINIAVSETLIWDTVDPYAVSDDVIQKLFAFGQNIMNDYNGRLGHLLAGWLIPPGQSATAGVAWTDVICSDFFVTGNGEPGGPYGVSANLQTTTAPFPNYSNNLAVVVHELGHNIGSPHTHACVWNGNNTQIDDCASVASGSGPSCYNAASPILPGAGGGTVMSYCDLLGSVGIDLANGFGPQPGDLIRQRYNLAPCVTGVNCSDIFGCTDPEAHNYNPNANMDDGSCETCDDGIQNGDETDVDCGGVLCEPCCDLVINELIITNTTCNEANGEV
ncbi:MAG: M12 family metallo-peptidase, partial [Bacteroidota bacterium]